MNEIFDFVMIILNNNQIEDLSQIKNIIFKQIVSKFIKQNTL